MLIPFNSHEILFEHRFWLQILGDHGRFITGSLSPDEKGRIEQAKQFIQVFDTLLSKARENISQEELNALNKASYDSAISFRNFKLSILKEQLVGNIKIHFPPTFINHMVNEISEYINILGTVLNNQHYNNTSVRHHLLWIPDASGHASGIATNLDMTEKQLFKKSLDFSKTFDELQIRTTEIANFMRTCLSSFPALEKLNEDASSFIIQFTLFLVELESQILEKKVLGTISPLMPDHMYREECYYLTKLSRVSQIVIPCCDPTKPRIDIP